MATAEPPFVVGTDVGGTFVDAVIMDAKGRIAAGKAPGTPGEPARGILAAIAEAAGPWGLAPEDVLGSCRSFLHGTTVTTNAMIERSGGPTGLLITRGFEDTLPIGRVVARTVGLDEAELLNRHRSDAPPPVIPHHLTVGIAERIDAEGRVLRALDLQEVDAAVASLLAHGIRSLAVCFLWSFLNPSHEQAVKGYLAERYPEIAVTISSDLVPLLGEYERANTTAVNAYLRPVVDGYLSDLDLRLRQDGLRPHVLIMQSIGGVARSEEIRTTPATTLYSGPVGGILAARQLGTLAGDRNIITTDMGGTSFDAGLVVEGEPETAKSTTIERQLLMVPAVRVATIGAGGGSVAWVDAAGSLRIGPRSQGAVPGPACYGRGGTEPTVTDADLLLGFIDRTSPLSGGVELDVDAAERALKDRVAGPLGMSVLEAAASIFEIVNAHMADLVRKVSIERGFDPRTFALYAFGGCGPIHASGYGGELGVPRIVIPSFAPVFSALGISQSDIRHSHARSISVTMSPAGPPSAEAVAAVADVVGQVIAEARSQLVDEGLWDSSAFLQPSLDMRYRGQVHELPVPVSEKGLGEVAWLTGAVEDFTRRYQQRYGPNSTSPSAMIQITAARVSSGAQTTALSIEPQDVSSSDGQVGNLGSRQVYWPSMAASVPTPVHVGMHLRPEDEITGPAIVELPGTSVPVPPSWRLQASRVLGLVMTNEGAESGRRNG